MFDKGSIKNILICSALSNGFIHDEVTLTTGLSQHCEQLLKRFTIKIFSKSKAVSTNFQRANRLLDRFLVIFSDTHHFTDRAHLRAKLVNGTREFLKSPSRKLDNDIIAAGRIFLERSLAPIWQLVQRHTRSEHR